MPMPLRDRPFVPGARARRHLSYLGRTRVPGRLDDIPAALYVHPWTGLFVLVVAGRLRECCQVWAAREARALGAARAWGVHGAREVPTNHIRG